MRSNRSTFLIPVLLLMFGCGGGGGNSSETSAPTINPASLAVTPQNPTVSVGSTQQFTATATFANSSSSNVTTLVTWRSSNTRVAGINSSGLATAAAAGTTTVSAAAGSATDSTTMTVPVPDGGNILSVTVNGSLCSGAFNAAYPNKPCVSVTVCTPDTGSCQTVNDILLDTGSFGLRLFKATLGTVSLPQSTVPSGDLAECVQFVDNTAMWGPVKSADVVLGGEAAVTLPIQVVDPTFGSVPAGCVPTGGTLQTSPSAAALNGILGVGLFVADCGTGCATRTNNGRYYACIGTSCTGTTVPVASQVQNPVASLPVDNNGVQVQLPAVPPGGTSSVSGRLVLGIGTRSNNTPSGMTVYPTTQIGEFTTIYNGITYSSSFIDSGSNGLFFSDAAIPTCAAPNAAWYCPASTLSLSAVNEGATGTPSGTVLFQVATATSLFASGNHVFSTLGGSSPPAASGFDWGLPFFFGRSVAVGIQGRSSPLGTGPYWAY